MKRTLFAKSERGSVPWGWLIALTLSGILVAGGVVALKLISKPPEPKASAVVVRRKIPPLPVSIPNPPGEDRQPGATEGIAPPPAAGETANPTPGAPIDSISPNPSQAASKPEQTEADAGIPAVTGGMTTAAASEQTTGDTVVSDSAEMPGAATAPVGEPNSHPDAPGAGTPESGSIEAPQAQPAAVDTAPPDTVVEKTEPFTIQVGAFRTRAYAENMVTGLISRGYPAFIADVLDRNQEALYLVRFGHFETREAATRSADNFTNREKLPAVVTLNEK